MPSWLILTTDSIDGRFQLLAEHPLQELPIPYETLLMVGFDRYHRGRNGTNNFYLIVCSDE